MCISDIHTIPPLFAWRKELDLVIKISYESDLPMYEQIEEAIKHAIYSGELANNDPLPSVRQLSADLSVSQITTKRAYADLEREGFIYTVLGRGTFVKLKDIGSLLETRKKEIMDEVEIAVTEAKKSNIDVNEIIRLVETIYGGSENE